MALSPRAFVAFWLALSPALPLTASSPPSTASVSPDDHAAVPVVWRIDAARSDTRFDIHLRFAPDSYARAKNLQGEVRWLDAQRWQVHLTLATEDLRFSGPAWVGRTAKSSAFLDAAQHPRILFESAPQPRILLEQGGRLRGLLTLRGQQREVVFDIQGRDCAQGATACALNVRGTVSREAFGMLGNRWAVKDNIDFRFQIRFAPSP